MKIIKKAKRNITGTSGGSYVNVLVTMSNMANSDSVPHFHMVVTSEALHCVFGSMKNKSFILFMNGLYKLYF